jgi:hypothetical protein
MIYKKTTKGQQVLKDRSVLLSPKQRVAFILFDGATPLQQILDTLSSMDVAQSDVDRLINDGLIEISTTYEYLDQVKTLSASQSFY